MAGPRWFLVAGALCWAQVVNGEVSVGLQGIGGADGATLVRVLLHIYMLLVTSMSRNLNIYLLLVTR